MLAYYVTEIYHTFDGFCRLCSPFQTSRYATDFCLDILLSYTAARSSREDSVHTDKPSAGLQVTKRL